MTDPKLQHLFIIMIKYMLAVLLPIMAAAYGVASIYFTARFATQLAKNGCPEKAVLARQIFAILGCVLITALLTVFGATVLSAI